MCSLLLHLQMIDILNNCTEVIERLLAQVAKKDRYAPLCPDILLLYTNLEQGIFE